jgi:hypothetical protein
MPHNGYVSFVDLYKCTTVFLVVNFFYSDLSGARVAKIVWCFRAQF